MYHLKKLSTFLTSLFLSIFKPLKAYEVVSIDNFGRLRAEVINNVTINIYCERKVLRNIAARENKQPRIVYRVYSHATTGASLGLKEACKLEIIYPTDTEFTISNQEIFDLLSAHYIEMLRYRLTML